MLQSLVAKDLSLCFSGGKTALNSVSLSLHTGVTAVIGPNGSGKSSLLRCLAGLIEPSSGSVEYCGIKIAQDSAQYRYVLGYLPQDFAGYSEMTVTNFLRYMGVIKLIPPELVSARVEEIMALFRLVQHREVQLSDLSRGVAQRLGIAQAFINDPDVLILDEPTVSLDIEERNELLQLIRAIAHDRLIVLSTHFPSDAEECADNVVVLWQGELLSNLATNVLRRKARGLVWEVTMLEPQALAVGLVTKKLATTQGTKMRLVSALKPDPTALQVEPSLEDAYVACINNLL